MKYLILITTLFFSHIAPAQFNGNSGDGQDHSATAGIQLSGAVVSNIVLYQGGEGDGFNRETSNLLLAGQPNALYSGGSGDGFSKLMETLLLSGDVQLVYSGGDGDGFSVLKTDAILNGMSLSSLFSGGDGDGFSLSAEDQVLLSGFMTMLFEGGDGDGFSKLASTDITLNGMMTELFNGGDGDGFSVFLLNSKTLTGELADLFNGGNGDGFATARLEGFTFEVLPVEWISFEAVKQETSVLLLWSTASENNNDRFEVERSVDGLSFDKITEVDGAGTIDTQQDYDALDEAPKLGINYYRVKQVDFDGNFSYTDIRSVLFEEEGFNVKIYPNPNRQRILNIDISGLEAKELITMRVFNNNGQLLKEQEVPASSTVDLSWDWPAGTYWLQLSAGSKKITRSLIIVD